MSGAETPSGALIRLRSRVALDQDPRPLRGAVLIQAATRTVMLDLIYLALGIGVFAVFSGYAFLLRRL